MGYSNYDDLATSWNNLANNVRGIGQDQFNASLGLAKFISEDTARQKDNLLKEQQAEENNFKLEKYRRDDAYMKQSPTLSELHNMVTKLTGGDDKQGALLLSELFPTFRLSPQDPENPDPNQPITSADGKQITRYDLQRVLPQFAQYALSATDVMPRLLNKMEAKKKELGLTSDGPTASAEELEALSKDPSKREGLEEYLKIGRDYIRYKNNPDVLAQAQRDKLLAVRADVVRNNGDTSILDARIKELDAIISQRNEQETKRQYTITKDIAALTGLREGERVSEDIFKTATTTGGNVRSEQIKGDATLGAARIHADATLGAANLHLKAAREQIASGKQLSAQQSIMAHLTVDIPKNVAASYDARHRKDAMGNYLDDNGKIIPQERVNAELQQEIEKAQSRAAQKLQDTGFFRAAGMEAPSGVIVAPVQVRQNVVDIGSKLEAYAAQTKDQKVIQLVENGKQTAAKLLLSRDPKDWNKAIEVLTNTASQVNQYLTAKQQPAAVKSRIVNNAKNVSTVPGRGLPASPHDVFR